MDTKYIRGSCLLLVLIMLLSSQSGFSVESATASEVLDVTDFRQCVWGMSPGEVRKVETATLMEETMGKVSILSYRGDLNGRPCRIVYRFIERRLAGGSYVLEGDFRPGQYLQWFTEIFQGLEKEYGTPIRDDVQWSSERERNLSQRLEDAIWAGSAQRVAVWIASPSQIALSVQSPGGPANVKLILAYESRVLKPVADRVR